VIQTSFECGMDAQHPDHWSELTKSEMVLCILGGSFL